MATPITLQVGVAFRDKFVLQNGAAWVTGLTDGSFTKQLSRNGTGNQSTTGITISEISAVTDQGAYEVSILSTAFLATEGSYLLKIFETANPANSVDQIYIVTLTGQPGSASTLNFTSSTADGRVTDGSSPISGATVLLRKTGTNFLIETTTAATGNWGPIAFDPSFGTVSITVQASGYQVGTASLSVGASSITGPGADIALTAVSSQNVITAGSLWSYARRMAANKNGTQADTKIQQLVNDALDRYAKDFKTSTWWWRRGQISFQAPYSTGTITLTNGDATVTLAGGTFPSWAAQGKFFVSGQILDVESRTNGTSVELDGAWNGDTTSATYVLFQDEYDLPDDLFEFGQIFQGQRWPYQPTPVGIQELWAGQNAFTISNSNTWKFAVHNGKLVVWPYPNEGGSWMYSYRARPVPLTDAADLADVDPAEIETLRHLINYYVGLYFGADNCVAGQPQECLALYRESLQAALANDKQPEQRSMIGRTAGMLPMWLTKTTPVPPF